jgi:membrane dipeptidase
MPYRLLLLIVAPTAFFFSLYQSVDYKKIHFDAIVVDTHNDVAQRMINGENISIRTMRGHSDLPRFREGGVDVEMFSIWVPPEKTARSYFDQANEQIDSVLTFAKTNSASVLMATSVRDIEKAVGDNKFAAMMGMEGGHHLDGDVENLDYFYRRGVRYMTLTWNNSTSWATSAKDESDPDTVLPHKGLSEQGKMIVRKMNSIGMMVDISHVGEQTFWDVMKTTSKPVIASHSSAWKLCPHRRNLKDEQLKAIAENGGVVFINFFPVFIDSAFTRKESEMRKRNQSLIDSLDKTMPGDAFVRGQLINEALQKEYLNIRPPLSVLIDHFDYVAKLIGVDHVGIGSDFDGISSTPRDMDDVTFLPNITRELLKRGYSEGDIRKILGENFLRVLKEVEKHE